MNQPEPRRRQFTLLQLLVVVGVIATVLGISTPLIRGWQERSVRDQCSNHLRELGICVHNYHDEYNYLPPLATDPDHWTWIALLMPYYESHGRTMPSQLTKRADPETLAQAASTPSNKQEVIGFRNPLFLCPARRQQATRAEGTYAGGQPTDYIAVSTSTELKWNSQGDGMIVYRLQPLATNTFSGLSATTLASVTDGLSNTFMIGEKHMQPSWIGGQYDEPALVAFEDPNTIRVATDQVGSKGLAQRRDDDDPWKFGSWHDGVTLFAFGDASVRAISNKTDTHTLRLLSCRNDGESVSIP